MRLSFGLTKTRPYRAAKLVATRMRCNNSSRCRRTGRIAEKSVVFPQLLVHVGRLSGGRQGPVGLCLAMQHAWPQPASWAIRAVASAMGRSYKQALPHIV
jgi:hypothetical protein